MKAYQEIFEIVHELGECLNGNLHIIDTSDNIDYFEFGEREYRVYHNEGYCFDIKRVIESYTDETETEVKEYEYYFYQEWEGFIKADMQYILKEMRYFKKGLRIR